MARYLLIKNARLRSGEIRDILIEAGKFQRIAPDLEVENAEVIDAKANLVTAPFCDPHLHLDATLSVGKPRYNMSGTLMEGIAIWGEYAATMLNKEEAVRHAVEVVKWEVANGSMFLRSHADATDPSGLALETLLEVREAVKDFADLQIVAFPQECVFTSPEAPNMMENAMKRGCDVVGGLPYFELSPEDGVHDVKFAFDLAEKYNAMVDIHCDENTDEQSHFLEYIAREAFVRHMGERVTASHTCAMHNYNNDYAKKIIGNVKRAGMNMITNPFANSCLQNRTDGYPRRRGHTRVDELLAAGVNVAIGSDDIMDPWYPMGKGSPLCGAQLLMNYAQLSGYSQVPQLFDMITDNPAKLLMLEGYGIKEGNPANLVILDCQSEFDAIRLTPEALYVIRKGKVICETTPAKRRLNVTGTEELIDFKVKD